MPSRVEIYAVFGAVVFFVHSWSIRGFLRELPSFLYYFSVGEISSVFAYMMAFALIESALVTFGLVCLAFILPANWMRHGFIYKGFLCLTVVAVAMIFLQEAMKKNLTGFNFLYHGIGITGLALAVLIFLFHKVRSLQRVAEFIVDRLGVLAYFYVPLGILSLIVVIVRNLF